VKKIKVKSGPFTFSYILLGGEPWVQEDGWINKSAKRLDGEVIRSLSEFGPRAKAIAVRIAKKEHQKSLQGELMPKA